ncbi:ubiquitin carboxyl-terminal hydrolase 2-like isoform X1 [Iris pallida]|uniref:Ubiquitin carboxyl-terminal hydrolase 2-like isoform X1 n=1 Tax=Iris pallida TaxID=29817 RepID=A0AAX6GG38_IRIPA|nr:ubiquitin carboxyl-terminal hydrolase 2-like isoform X1 [Iris pallida]KAJ6827704.1 ubiquitin carboxyl-terminal hydrolase 2-like isoform X1 [Iris pallida]
MNSDLHAAVTASSIPDRSRLQRIPDDQIRIREIDCSKIFSRSSSRSVKYWISFIDHHSVAISWNCGGIGSCGRVGTRFECE